MEEYTYSKWFKIVISFFLVILIGVFATLIFMPYFDDKMSINAIYIIAPISVSLIILCVLGVKDLFVSKVIITDTFISSKNALSKRNLRIDEIKGFKTNEYYIFIYPKDKLKKRIKISNHISDDGEIGYWLHNNFINLNLEDEVKEVKVFQRNSEYGISTEDKYALLNNAHKISKFIKIISISITVISLFLIKYFKEDKIIYAVVFIPLIIIFIVISFKGVIKYDEKKEDEHTIYPSVLWGFLAPIFGLLLYVLFSINILKYDAIWELLIYTTLIVFFLCIYGSKEYKFENPKAIGTVISLLLFSAMYCFSVIIIYNVLLDNSSPKLYKASILEKRISKGKTTSYYFKLNNKELYEESRDFDVSHLIFDSKNIGDSVNIFVNKGKLNIPYYKIE